jgi:predicted PurR-regulated permease PerM
MITFCVPFDSFEEITTGKRKNIERKDISSSLIQLIYNMISLVLFLFLFLFLLFYFILYY